MLGACNTKQAVAAKGAACCLGPRPANAELPSFQHHALCHMQHCGHHQPGIASHIISDQLQVLWQVSAAALRRRCNITAMRADVS